jgi:D-alanyl-D-alanine carboxypeptidase
LIRLAALTLLLAANVEAGGPATNALPRWQELQSIADDAKFNGIVLASKGDERVWAYAGKRTPGKGKQIAPALPATPNGSGRYSAPSDSFPEGSKDHFDVEESWRWASVTKQIVAVLVVQEAAKGTIDLDKPVSAYLPGFKSENADQITVRALLRHQSGLPNPDDSQRPGLTMADYYLKTGKADRDPLTGYCAGPVKGPANGNWSYNNCDYIVAGALLKAVTGKEWAKLFDERIAKPFKLRSAKTRLDVVHTQEGFIGDKKEPGILLQAFDASGAISGSVVDLWRFDRALMTGKLLPSAQMDILWDGKPELGFIALGQWVFEAPLTGCDKPVRIVERRGAIGGVQVRNFILPEKDTVVIAFTNRAEFEFGEVWQGAGLSHDLLAKAACG